MNERSLGVWEQAAPRASGTLFTSNHNIIIPVAILCTSPRQHSRERQLQDGGGRGEKKTCEEGGRTSYIVNILKCRVQKSGKTHAIYSLQPQPHRSRVYCICGQGANANVFDQSSAFSEGASHVTCRRPLIGISRKLYSSTAVAAYVTTVSQSRSE